MASLKLNESLWRYQGRGRYMLYLKKVLQLMRIIGLLKYLIFNHWNVAIFRKIRVQLDVLQAT